MKSFVWGDWGKTKLCMVPCHSYSYETWRSRGEEEKVLKLSYRGWASHRVRE